MIASAPVERSGGHGAYAPDDNVADTITAPLAHDTIQSDQYINDSNPFYLYLDHRRYKKLTVVVLYAMAQQ